ncbi:hypothetical protein HDU67_002236 [Dinochytrium kinnereticum]|nr:hypothetical protein HDU67_002236 [Dinochytrium kinnereticum]
MRRPTTASIRHSSNNRIYAESNDELEEGEEESVQVSTPVDYSDDSPFLIHYNNSSSKQSTSPPHTTTATASTSPMSPHLPSSPPADHKRNRPPSLASIRSTASSGSSSSSLVSNWFSDSFRGFGSLKRDSFLSRRISSASNNPPHLSTVVSSSHPADSLLSSTDDEAVPHVDDDAPPPPHPPSSPWTISVDLHQQHDPDAATIVVRPTTTPANDKQEATPTAITFFHSQASADTLTPDDEAGLNITQQDDDHPIDDQDEPVDIRSSSRYHRFHPPPPTSLLSTTSATTSNPLYIAKQNRWKAFRRGGSSTTTHRPPPPPVVSGTGHTSTLAATLNSANVMLGMGILSIPFALSHAGWVCGVMMLAGFALICARTAILLGKCMEIRMPISSSSSETTPLLSSSIVVTPNPHPHPANASSVPATALLTRAPLSYPDIGELAFGKPGRHLVTTLFTLELFAASTALVIICSDSIQALAAGSEWGGWVVGDSRVLKCIVSAVFTVTTLPQQSRAYARVLAAGSVVGILTLVNLVVILGYYGIVRPVLVGGGGDRDAVMGFVDGSISGGGSVWEPAETFAWPSSFVGFGVAAGLFIVNLDAHAVFPNIYRDLKVPADFPKVVKRTYTMNFLLYLFFMSVGYLMFGRDDACNKLRGGNHGIESNSNR